MTKGKKFKEAVRERAAREGVNYTQARAREVDARCPPPRCGKDVGGALPGASDDHFPCVKKKGHAGSCDWRKEIPPKGAYLRYVVRVEGPIGPATAESDSYIVAGAAAEILAKSHKVVDVYDRLLDRAIEGFRDGKRWELEDL